MFVNEGIFHYSFRTHIGGFWAYMQPVFQSNFRGFLIPEYDLVHG